MGPALYIFRDMLDIYLVQMEIAPNDKSKNFDKVRKLTAGIRYSGDIGGLIVLPEMFATGYLPLHPENAAEDFSCRNAGETAAFLGELADTTGCAVLGAGIAHGTCSKAQLLFNHSSVYLPRNPYEYACYDKQHPFFMELAKFTPGHKIGLFEINHWNTAATICFDLRFPELYRDAVKAGARLVTVQAAWPAERIAHWKTLLQARAIENQVYIAAVNCVTPDGTYSGCSMVIDPKGEIVACSEDGREGVISARIESAPQEEYRQKFPVLKGII